MDFTGERFINDGNYERERLATEHWSRYLWAGKFVQDKVVLDIACGEGYGSNYLSSHAQRVIGGDISSEAVKYASAHYLKDNLTFEKMSIDNISYPNQYFDVVVSFETIEHVSEAIQDKAFSEYARVLKDDGVLIISTPNTQSPNYFKGNIFHKKELSVDEFQTKLQKYFKSVHILGQSLYEVSVIGRQTFDVLDRNFPNFDKDFYDNVTDDTYIIALASKSSKDFSIRGSVLINRDSIHILSKLYEKSGGGGKKVC